MPANPMQRAASAIPTRRARTLFALHSAFAKVKKIQKSFKIEAETKSERIILQ